MTPRAVAATVALALAALVLARLAAGGGDPSRFVVAGEDFTSAGATPVPVRVLPGAGYDGQFYLRLALDPWPSAADGQGTLLSPPGYRHQRILYPLLARAFALGRPAAIPWTLIWVDVLALVALAFATAGLAARCGVPASWGLAAPAFAGLLMALGRDLAEPVAAALLAGAVLAQHAGRSLGAGLLLSLAVLARETSVVAAIAFAATPLLARDRAGAPGWPAALLPLGVFALWQGALALHWGGLPFLQGAGLDWPLVGLATALWQTPWLARPLESGVALVEMLWLALLAREVVARARAPRDAGATFVWVRAAWLSWSAVVLCWPRWAWADDWSFLRASSDWALLGLCAIWLAGARPGRSFALATGLLAAITCVRLVVRA